MKTFVALAALVALVLATPQGVTQSIKPDGANPDGCMATYNGQFEVTIATVNAKRDLALQKRDCSGSGLLVATLQDGVLKDSQGRTGYIADNYQFQFDAPPQAGAIVTAGFAVCGNGSLALGPSSVFYQCASGSFSNLYDRSWAAHCGPIHVNVIPCGGASNVGQKPDGQVGQIPDGQIIGTTMKHTTVVTVIADGQPQVIATEIPVPLCQIGDGQVQAHTTPCAEMPIPTATGAPVSQISDGQIQVPGATGAAPPAGSGSGSSPSGSGGSGGGSETGSSPAGTSAPATQPNGSQQKVVPASVVAFVVGFAALLTL